MQYPTVPHRRAVKPMVEGALNSFNGPEILYKPCCLHELVSAAGIKYGQDQQASTKGPNVSFLIATAIKSNHEATYYLSRTVTTCSSITSSFSIARWYPEQAISPSLHLLSRLQAHRQLLRTSILLFRSSLELVQLPEENHELQRRDCRGCRYHAVILIAQEKASSTVFLFGVTPVGGLRGMDIKWEILPSKPNEKELYTKNTSL